VGELMAWPSPVADLAPVVALASLSGLGPRQLRRILERFPAAAAWRAVCAGSLPVDLVAPDREVAARTAAKWRTGAAGVDPSELLDRHADAGIGVALYGSPSYPASFLDDPLPPPVVFWRGDLDHLAGMRAGMVGTRDATRYGRDVARDMAAELSRSGVSVVSGLALGIDGAAHAGALGVDGAPPVAVVGGGLDRTYPRAHAALWRDVAERGVVLSEYPLGTPPAAWRFPARNRLIAALSDVVVVVESHATGGSMITAMAADERGRQVMAVPGPVTAPSSAGTNALLFEGAAPARDAADVLLALGVTVPRRRAAESRSLPRGPAATVLDALPWQPTSLEQVLLSTGLDIGVVALALDELEDSGWISRAGGWVERLGRDQRSGVSR
jgi:DNA processing protein